MGRKGVKETGRGKIQVQRHGIRGRTQCTNSNVAGRGASTKKTQRDGESQAVPVRADTKRSDRCSAHTTSIHALSKHTKLE